MDNTYIIGLIIYFIGCFMLGTFSKKMWQALLIWMFIYSGCLIMWYDFSKTKDYPEEIVGVSFDKSKPDTLISYQTKDTIFIEFVPKTK